MSHKHILRGNFTPSETGRWDDVFAPFVTLVFSIFVTCSGLSNIKI